MIWTAWDLVSLNLYLIWTSQGVDDIKDSTSWAQVSRCYEQLKTMDEIKDSRSWGKGSRYDEQLKAIVDMNDFGSWA